MRLAAASLAVLLATALGGRAQDSEAIGRAIFLDNGGEVTVGPNSIAADGALFPCKNCHGIDGGGKAEGPVTFPPIVATGTALDVEILGLTLRTGTMPDGRRLDALMPRYNLTEENLSSLADYLDALPREQRAGVDPTEIRVAVVSSAEHGGVARVISAELNRRFDEAATKGMIFGRRMRAVAVIGRAELRAARNALAVVGLVSDDPGIAADLAAWGVPNLFSFSPVFGDEDPDLVRGAGASVRDVLASLVAALSPGELVVICGAGREADLTERLAVERKLVIEVRSPNTCLDSDKGAQLVLLAPFDQLAPAALHGRRIIGPIDVLAPQAASLRQHGAAVALVNVRPELMRRAMTKGTSLPAAHAEMVAALLDRVLRAVGRDVTRAGLVAAVDSLQFAEEGFPQLDYHRAPLTGASALETLELTPTETPRTP